ncbi:type IV pilus secretin PilQ [Thiohalobacter sp. IOR34]|uniref:type IV pilus secretin PilQ n=1 Tax=Thiohalobacter sp. IOR34 TaxID=3057176 RepID=UPI0025AF306C|nr:type IV pilus secretin PilQ [Thiohalobacter sp. IOR34]WJW75685.1 type IV pilus secretin PilQ [Thiohalobacter sp. IOR34]
MSHTFNARIFSAARLLAAALLAAATLLSLPLQAGEPNTLEGIDIGSLPGNRVQVILKLSKPAPQPLSFTIDNPARIALDLPNTVNRLPRRSQTIGVGLAKSLTAVEAKGRTRVVLNLVELAPYETKVSGNNIILTLTDPAAAAAAAAAASTAPAETKPVAQLKARGQVAAVPSIDNIDFRRGEKGEGRVLVKLSDPSTAVNIRQEGKQVVVDFIDVKLPQELARRLDVLDFATPVKTVDTFSQGNNARVVVSATGDFDHVAYQTNDLFVIEVSKATKEELEQRKREKIGYTGERLSLNFQDIEVRSVLQLIADFTGTNIVVSDTVTGNLTLRLQNVPWDQALDIILKTKGLAMRKNDDVMLVAPSEEIAAREKLELEAQKQIEELAPLYSEYIQINYAKAKDIAALLRGEEGSSLLSERGSVSIDQRTNTLLVQDTADKLEDIRRLINRLDIPVRQVLIESRIVIANDDFAKDIGARLGVGRLETSNTTTTIIGGGLEGDLAQSGVYGSFITNPADSDPPVEALMTDLRVTNPMGAVNLLIGRLGREFLRLELSAMQAEGRGEVISSPRVITSDQQEAEIIQGVEIPYLQAASSGAATVSFKEAVLGLTVTPQITPDDRIIMDLVVRKDNVGQVYEGVPSINTRSVETQVLVDNGETVVLGGIYERTKQEARDQIPVLGDLPAIGFMFRQDRKVDDKSELLVFVTPKIIKESLSTR